MHIDIPSVLGVASVGLGLANAQEYDGYKSAFSFNDIQAVHPAWMADIANDTHLSSMSIPGTHDTMTYNLKSHTFQCQNSNLSVQLESGLRYFDIRARVRHNELYIYHANDFTGFSFEQVLLTMFDFLDRNPSEALMMRVKKEGSDIGHNRVNFEEAFQAYLDKGPTAQGAKKHIYAYKAGDALPSLGSVRSKILLFQNFEAKHGPYGVLWDGHQMVLEDKYAITRKFRISSKLSTAKKAVVRAYTEPLNNEQIYLAHCSAAIGILPIQAAAGTKKHDGTGMNDWMGEWLDATVNEKGATRTGIVIF